MRATVLVLLLAACGATPLEEAPVSAPVQRMRSEWYEPGKRLKRQVELLVFGDGTAQKNGAEHIWYPDGTPHWERHYLRDRPTGTWRSYHPSGQLATYVEIDGADGLGKMQRFHPDGSLAAEGTGKNALPEGSWKIFHPEASGGSLAEEGDYARGKRHGRWRFWNVDGELTAEGEYEDGERVGRWLLLNRDGVWVEREAAPALVRPEPERVQ